MFLHLRSVLGLPVARNRHEVVGFPTDGGSIMYILVTHLEHLCRHKASVKRNQIVKVIKKSSAVTPTD